VRETFAYKHKQWLAVFFILILSSGVVAAPIPPDKMKPEEVIAKHLAAIGPADALTAVKSRIMIGSSVARLKLTNAPIEVNGPAEFASEGEKVLLAMAFNSNNYPFEKAGYDGQKLTVALLTNGRHSPLSDFLLAQDAIFKQGLFGGVLSSAWPLLNLNSKNVKLSYAGTDKIDGRQVHELKCSARGAGNLKINLFFDAETFQHVRTEYQYEVEAGMTAKATSSVQSTATDPTSMSRYKLVEDFSDFKAEGKLMLPHTYKLHLTIDTQARTQFIDWTITFAQFAFDQPIDAGAFNVAQSK
jgi:hypothetical protein